MSRIAIVIAASLIASMALADAPKPRCAPIAEMKAEPELKSVKFTPLTPSQFLFIRGVYAGSPVTPPGSPPGDGALLFQINGKNMIIWTHGKDTACMSVIIVAPSQNGGPPKGAYMPMPISDDTAGMLKSIRDGKVEASPTNDEDYDVDKHLGHRS